MAKTFIVQNVSKRVLPINLDTFKGKRRDSIHLAHKEKSRPLTEKEFKSREISELLRIKPRASLKVFEQDSAVVAKESKPIIVEKQDLKSNINKKK